MTDVVTPVSTGTKIGQVIATYLNAFMRLTDNSGNEIGSLIGTRAYGTSVRIAIGSTTGQSAALTLPKGEVLVHASSRCFITWGSNPTATNAGVPLEAGEKWHFQMTDGHKIAVIRDTADGFLNIAPVA